MDNTETRTQPLVVVKIGGRAASVEAALRDLAREMAALKERFRFLLVHGGGAEVSRVSKVFGLEPVFRDGIRQTSPAEMDIVDMVLAGKMNKSFVRLFCGLGLPSVGISGSDGGFFTGQSIDRASGNRTGRVTHVDPAPALALLNAGYMPLVATTSVDEAGGALNINADEAALAIARSLGSESLVYLSDIPGILKDGAVLMRLDSAGVEREIAAGVISGGMIPKVRSSLEALRGGVRNVVIGEFSAAGDLERLLEAKQGTTLAF
jgi:acetylglutamate kinase